MKVACSAIESICQVWVMEYKAGLVIEYKAGFDSAFRVP